MNIADRVVGLFDKQNQLNCHYAGADWAEQNFPFTDYIWIEAAELLDHHGKIFHYKKPKENREQVIGEFIDILHFGLSHMIMAGVKLDTVMIEIGRAEMDNTDLGLIYYVREVVKASVKRKFDVFYFVKALNSYGLSFDKLADMYIGKHTLNTFRIDNGDTEGNYVKVWDGKEDNEHLSEILSSVNPECTNVPSYIYQELQKRYDLYVQSAA